MAKQCQVGYGCGDSCISRSKNCESVNPPETKNLIENFSSTIDQYMDEISGTQREKRPDLKALLEQGREEAKKYIAAEVVDGDIAITPSTMEFEMMRDDLISRSELTEKEILDRVQWDSDVISDERKKKLGAGLVDIAKITNSLPKVGFKMFKKPGKNRGYADSGFSPEAIQALDNEIKDLPLQEKLNIASQEYLDSPFEAGINVGAPRNREDSLVYHEFAHHVEYANRDMASVAQEWLVSRSGGQVKKLNELTGTNNYRDSEIAVDIPDLLHPYVGKIYRMPASHPQTEVLSMGLEHFTSAREMRELYRADKEHFFFILGVLKTLGK